jgi:hypothetical protein
MIIWVGVAVIVLLAMLVAAVQMRRRRLRRALDAVLAAHAQREARLRAEEELAAARARIAELEQAGSKGSSEAP